MTFGPVNVPTIFIRFMHDMNFEWQQLALCRDVPIGPNINRDVTAKGKLLPFEINIMHKSNEYSRTIDRTERHNPVAVD